MDGLSGLFGAEVLGDRGAGNVSMKNGAAQEVEKELMSAVGMMAKGGKEVLLVMDGLDLLLAATGAEAKEVMDLVQELMVVRFMITSDLKRIQYQCGC